MNLFWVNGNSVALTLVSVVFSVSFLGCSKSDTKSTSHSTNSESILQVEARLTQALDHKDFANVSKFYSAMYPTITKQGTKVVIQLHATDPQNTGNNLWEMDSAKFHSDCKQLLKDGVPTDEEEQGGVYGFLAIRTKYETVIIDGAKFAYIATQLEEHDLAIDLFHLVQQTHSEYKARYIAENYPTVQELVANKIVLRLRTMVTVEAHTGAPRSELLVTWEFISQLPYHRYIKEAKQMMQDYETMIKEDQAWKEPDAKEIVNLEPSKQAEYWIYHLRDADFYQSSDPGSCSVTGWEAVQRSNQSNPANELVKLGKRALPQLVDHLKDTCPTRSKGHWRSFAPESYYLLSIGNCCQQIYEEITQHQSDHPNPAHTDHSKTTDSYPFTK